MKDNKNKLNTLKNDFKILAWEKKVLACGAGPTHPLSFDIFPIQQFIRVHSRFFDSKDALPLSLLLLLSLLSHQG